MKICTACKLEKPLTDFNKLRKGSESIRATCKICETAKHREYVNKRKAADEDFRVACNKNSHDCRRNKKHSDDNFRKAEIARSRASKKKKMASDPVYFRTRKTILYAARKAKYHTDEYYRMVVNLRNRFNIFLRSQGLKKTMSFSRKYNIDFDAIYEKLGERPDGHQLDHIIPLAMFDVTNPRHVYLAHLPCNLRWFPGDDNARKNDTIDVDVVNSDEGLLAIYNEVLSVPFINTLYGYQSKNKQTD